MTLYVRSQDKTVLAKVEALQCVLVAHGKHAIVTTGVELGRYETKQRCLEILDEIQKLIVDSDKTLLTTTSFLDKETYDEILKEIAQNKFNVMSCENAQLFPLNQTVVYQMPEK